jgi:hypothetical protein
VLAIHPLAVPYILGDRDNTQLVQRLSHQDESFAVGNLSDTRAPHRTHVAEETVAHPASRTKPLELAETWPDPSTPNKELSRAIDDYDPGLLGLLKT